MSYWPPPQGVEWVDFFTEGHSVVSLGKQVTSTGATAAQQCLESAAAGRERAPAAAR